jgi:hypothetical protein
VKSGGWTPQQIICVLPRSGPGSSGETRVVVRDHSSNIVPLTEWEGRMDYTLTGHGSLKEDYGMPLRFRLDAHLFRNTPGETPHGPSEAVENSVGLTRLSYAGTQLRGTYRGQGSGSLYNDCFTLTWSGTAPLKNSHFDFSPTFVPYYGAWGTIDPVTKKIVLRFIGASTYDITIAQCNAPSMYTPGVGSATYSYTDQPIIDTYLSGDWSLSASQKTFTVPHPVAGNFPNATVLWKWSALTVKTPPRRPYPAGWAS